MSMDRCWWKRRRARRIGNLVVVALFSGRIPTTHTKSMLFVFFSSLNMSSNYACPCLNVLVSVQAPPPPDTPPSTPTDSNYQPVYVGEEGISIVRIRLF